MDQFKFESFAISSFIYCYIFLICDSSDAYTCSLKTSYVPLALTNAFTPLCFFTISSILV